MKKIEANIMGHTYTLHCPEAGETLLREAVEKVDKAMCQIRDAGKIKARDKIAVLAALNIAAAQSGSVVEKPTSPESMLGQPAGIPLASTAAQTATQPSPWLRSTLVASDQEPDRAGGTSANNLTGDALIDRLDQALRDDNHLL